MTKEKLTLEDKLKILEDAEKKTRSELLRVYRELGREYHEGKVKGDHLTRIVNYLIRQEKEEYRHTLAKLSLLLGIGQRVIRENYLQGLELFGFMTIETDKTKVIWKWNFFE